MFCPQCGSTQSDELKFCKSCGANLHALRQVLAGRVTDDKFDWSKTWVAEMFMSDEEVSEKAETERVQLTPELKRLREIKAGVITSSVGLGLMIFLFVLMAGIVAGGVSDKAAAILSRLFIVGVIPFLVGIALIINGVFVTKRGELSATGQGTATREPEGPPDENYLPAVNTNQLESGVPFSVTDQTTRHLTKEKSPRN